jgi:hypothetical protein
VKLTRFVDGVGEKEGDSQCQEQIHHVRRGIGAESSSWRAPDVASTRVGGGLNTCSSARSIPYSDLIAHLADIVTNRREAFRA